MHLRNQWKRDSFCNEIATLGHSPLKEDSVICVVRAWCASAAREWSCVAQQRTRPINDISRGGRPRPLLLAGCLHSPPTPPTPTLQTSLTLSFNRLGTLGLLHQISSDRCYTGIADQSCILCYFYDRRVLAESIVGERKWGRYWCGRVTGWRVRGGRRVLVWLK